MMKITSWLCLFLLSLAGCNLALVGGKDEVCENLLDDDGDGLTDCGDPDCQGRKVCTDKCGNGQVDPWELCDLVIAEGAGRCPVIGDCDDRVACTVDTLLGQGCWVQCDHLVILEVRAGDGCCPSGATAQTDSDCPENCGDRTCDSDENCRTCSTDCGECCGNGALDSGETCDPPESCPTACDDGDACTIDTLTGAAQNCNAACSHLAITQCSGGDGCCPAGCNATIDDDCSPGCGDITLCTSGDGCCPAGCNPSNDGDCTPTCSPGEPQGSCPAGSTCINGSCMGNELLCAPVQPTGVCPSGQSCLEGRCVNQGDLCSLANPAGLCPLGKLCAAGTCESVWSCAGLVGADGYPRPPVLTLWSFARVGERTDPRPGETFAVLAYDTLRAKPVAFDPQTGTWEWDESTGWKLQADLAFGPAPGEVKIAAAYDEARGRVVLFGGPSMSVWEWDGASWEGIAPAGAAPFARTDHAMTYDPDLRQVLLFGGRALDGAWLNDLWAWDGTAWSRPTAQSPLPPAQYQHGLAYDRARHRLVVFGSYADVATWEWDGAAWSRHPVAPLASSWSFTSLAYHQVSERVFLVSGNSDRFITDGTPWSFDGSAWTALATDGTQSRSEEQSAVAYDTQADRILLLFRGGLRQGELWTLAEVPQPNHPPAITLPAELATRLWPGDTLQVVLQGSDPDGHTVYFVAANLPAGASLDPDTGLLEWTPTAGQVGVHSFSVGVTDGELCNRKDIQIEVVDPNYSNLPPGAYDLYAEAIYVPTEYQEYYPPLVVFDTPDASLECSLFGSNPGKLIVVCSLYVWRAWYSGGIGSEIWTDASYYIGQSPVEPDGRFSIPAGLWLGTHHSRYPCIEDTVGVFLKECPTLVGHIRAAATPPQLDVMVERLDTRCPQNNYEKGAVGPTAGKSPWVLFGFEGYYHDPTVTPNVPMDGYGLGAADFWHPVQQRFIRVAGPFWLETGGMLKDVDGNPLATTGSRIPILDPSITYIGRDPLGQLIVVR